MNFIITHPATHLHPFLSRRYVAIYWISEITFFGRVMICLFPKVLLNPFDIVYWRAVVINCNICERRSCFWALPPKWGHAEPAFSCVWSFSSWWLVLDKNEVKVVFGCYKGAWQCCTVQRGRSWVICFRENDRSSTALKKNGNMKKLQEGGRVKHVRQLQKGYACVRKVWFLVTVEPASMWPLLRWRQCRGNRADGWLAGVSAPLWSTTGILCPFVSIRRRRRGAEEDLLYVFIPLATFPLLIVCKIRWTDRLMLKQSDRCIFHLTSFLWITLIPMFLNIFIFSVY